MEALFGDYEEISKSGLFDTEYYLATYPDVEARNVDPLLHYLEEGAEEGRNPRADFDSAFYLAQCRAKGESPKNPLLHYLRIGSARGFKTAADASAIGQLPTTDAKDSVKKAPVLVAIESLGLIGGTEGKSRLSVGGWALADSPIVEISASLDGEILGTATYGLARSDVARLYPERTDASKCGFILAFDLPGLASGAIEPLLTVRTANGEIGHRPLRVQVPPQEVQVAVDDPLDLAGTPAAGDQRIAMQLYLDNAGVDRSGVLRVDGWVVCVVQIESVEVFIDGSRVGAAEFGRARNDVEQALLDYPNARFSGFIFIGDVGRYGPGIKRLAIKATARTGITGEATAQIPIPVRLAAGGTPPDPSVYSHLEETALTAAGRVMLKGWAVCPSPAERIAILLDGADIGAATLGVERAEIGNLFPLHAHARNSGFTFETQLDGIAAADRHLLVARVYCADGSMHDVSVAISAGDMRNLKSLAPPDDPDFRLHLDAPYLIDGMVETPIRGNLEIGGWALARDGVDAIEIAVDGTPVALADYGLRRLDVKASFPEWEGSLASGYSALLPHRILPAGTHMVQVTLRDRKGKLKSTQFRIEVEEFADAAGPWALRLKVGQAEIDLGHRILQACGRRPIFVAILPLPTGSVALQQARTTIESLSRQAYAEWRLFVVPENSRDAAPTVRKRLLASMEFVGESVEIAADGVSPGLLASFRARAGVAARGMFLTVLAPGDRLGSDAFLEMALAAVSSGAPDFLYSDERRRDSASGAVKAFFKPRWSPDLLLSTNYIGRLWCVRADRLDAVTEPTETLLQRGEYDLLLRCTETAKEIQHVPAVLCERGDTIEDEQVERAALTGMLERRSIAGEVLGGLIAGTYRVKRFTTDAGLVSIIIPTRAAEGMIQTCIKSLRQVTAYRNYEIICIENIPESDRKSRTWLRRNADRVIAARQPFNWSAFNNRAVAEAKGEYLLFLNDDIEITEPGWLDALLEQARRPEIGTVGARLLYPDGRVQHAGMFLAALGQARHAFRYAAKEDPGYFGLALTQRNVASVTGACLMTRRETFAALGGFDETQSIVNNDLDYCLRAWRSGLLNVYTPHATLVHHEAISRAALDDVYDEAVFDDKWRDLFLVGDPFFSPHLSKRHDDFAYDDEPTRRWVAGRPTMSRDAIRKILVVKLDHIGDNILAFPAVRRLKGHFPQARISVLTSHSSRPVWGLEPCVDDAIEFDFFHARSDRGELELSDEDWRQLYERLAPERFDLAVDLRKHTETRPVLRHTGARYLAGFDFRNQFPWLDISLEWSGDLIYARKRQHNADDLINLVDAIGAACDSDRTVIMTRPPRNAASALLDPARRAGRPLVFVHPTVGNETRQWPWEYFAAVIDRLVEIDGARIVLIGTPGDEAIAANIIGRVRQPSAVTSLVGKVSLADLPAVLTEASLFLGNNSGPKHIAAGLGIPTVGVHSGTVDVIEWGPIGPNAIAVARAVVCAPCYLAEAADCRREMACLTQLEPARVYEACKRLLTLGTPPPAAGGADLRRNARRAPARAGKRNTAIAVDANPK
ncbi:MAG TPA: glycosyltransferase family 9 protein [Stellaceae bacterium]|jgi:ADP-heptose:LPS heptosyltransferase/GT2 family glycosyltransferase|nr:glycosyltransferase family 9 protein [Stellaceae bacterium]